MQGFFRKPNNNRPDEDLKAEKNNSSDESSDTTSEEEEYDFKPLKNDSTDEFTGSLFEQLEEGYKYPYTDIFGTIQSGANLFAVKTEGEFKGCYPIHVAAYMVGFNTEAVANILQAFDDPQKRKDYIYLKDADGKNVLEILIECAGMEEDIALPSVISVLSFLTAEEQKALLNSLSKEAKQILFDDELHISREKDIVYFSELSYFFKQGNCISLCQQRRKEEALLLADYDSDDESLGVLSSISHKKFTARITYVNKEEKGIIVESIPELMLIPSDWRLPTAIEGGHQGDHVTAYVLLLSSFSHCKGESIKNLPQLICKLAITVLPDNAKYFLEAQENIGKIIKSHTEIRKEAVASLQAECTKDKTFTASVENSLRKVEIELIARHIEETIDKFITIVNELHDETFPQKRKESINASYLLQQLIVILKEVPFLNEKKYNQFMVCLIQTIDEESKKSNCKKTDSVSDKMLTNIITSFLKYDLEKVEIPAQLLSKQGNLTQKVLLNFLKNHVPLKKYHEGYAIRDISTQVSTLKETKSATKRKKILNEIGFLCFCLFDYPRVNNTKLNDLSVLCQALPRHLIIINAAFGYLKNISSDEKKIIYNAFLNHVLKLQLWSQHEYKGKKQENCALTLNVLNQKILEFSSLDEEYNFSIKPKSEKSPVLNIVQLHK